ncbi:MAG: hypothetical protein Q4F24_02150 [Eubacteriales bacterium]|nr:hypothetical protein [Eubacteriales bacterium]
MHRLITFHNQSGEIALDVESLPCANGCSEAPSQTLPLGICYVDQESGAHAVPDWDTFHCPDI